ncbi:MAG: hypothetical protein C3L25_05585 [Candidatus Sedimenticola endophacoides]|uniref:OmpA-like domain-containing protein n=1 Tax=Candidatus Sedimenticola endophacoides TaxID=2548426 RepID=A0A6N4E9V5_9GAMM|nr:MAG: hypothetical protein B0D94_05510 [Candidatus Sedimenticola endophacoides]OQX43016.1 MAG: hypothetical protein B0D89_00125 [Candidatus Sedimenticola endophacoides]PUE00579.1 MAG: hypothetical protein C3L26_05595 [Candidatus Sedimenticola endophacoides]PUE04091.1 MAG: hypothetical protein C3L25_05585 [Candidatus Sedimenticola endophacoides]PUE05766.1 MAG: hypothetical protein C3L24_00255 [Candidatus Sedimenticola endophacoides]
MVMAAAAGVSPLADAAEADYRGEVRLRQQQGMGIGALAGALIGGPPGLVVGLAGGALLGRDSAMDQALGQARQDLEGLRLRLTEESLRQQRLEGELRDSRARRARQLRMLVEGFSINIQFRTATALLEPEYPPRLRQLAATLMALPELRLRIDAHADARGSEPLNNRLSRRRAEAVVGFLRDAGVAPGRMQAHSHGEQRHGYARQDREGMGFDRR